MEIGQKIKKLRELKNLTQEYMADELGITQSAYSKIETGESDVSYGKLERIAQVLEIRPEDIVTFNEHMVFNIMHNKDGQNGLIINQMSDELKKSYETQFRLMTEQIEHLKAVLDRVLGK